MTDYDALHAALDEAPGDRLTRLAIADLCEAAGFEVEAAWHRFAGKNGKRPARLNNGRWKWFTDMREHLSWWIERENTDRGSAWIGGLVEPSQASLFRYEHSYRRLAEANLVDILLKNGVLVARSRSG